MIFEINEKSKNGIKYIFLLLPALYLFKLNISTLIISILPLIFFYLNLISKKIYCQVFIGYFFLFIRSLNFFQKFK